MLRAAVPVPYHNSSSPDGFVAHKNKNRCGERWCIFLVSFYIQHYMISNSGCNVLVTRNLAILILPNILFSGLAIAFFTNV